MPELSDAIFSLQKERTRIFLAQNIEGFHRSASKDFDEEFCKEFLNTLIEERKRKEKIELDELKKPIVCEAQTFEESSCPDIEMSTDRGNIGHEVRSNLRSEARFKAEVEVRLKANEEAKAVEEGRKMEEERKMNERIALEEEMRLKKERWLVEEQTRHVQQEHKMNIKAEEQKCLQEVPAEDEKVETSVDVIKDKDDLNS
ncbi:hypothetical protein TNIN_427941 [Trichonephila inaurata madagascariensis]|uniref:Uncharacterized protein n=1 Tax=Trichonephila inaurata madagascariensis TaxID=2747483 RepID=A0A8X6WVF3_9ARAC|nr:hypothetical protein TNIN_427941 [Trichonephila inaurata madagascariensis]